MWSACDPRGRPHDAFRDRWRRPGRRDYVEAGQKWTKIWEECFFHAVHIPPLHTGAALSWNHLGNTKGRVAFLRNLNTFHEWRRSNVVLNSSVTISFVRDRNLKFRSIRSKERRWRNLLMLEQRKLKLQPSLKCHRDDFGWNLFKWHCCRVEREIKKSVLYELWTRRLGCAGSCPIRI